VTEVANLTKGFSFAYIKEALSVAYSITCRHILIAHIVPRIAYLPWLFLPAGRETNHHSRQF
jgi:hypothetical protein